MFEALVVVCQLHVCPPQIMIFQQKKCTGKRTRLVSCPWSLNIGRKGDKEYLLFLAGVPAEEKLVDV